MEAGNDGLEGELRQRAEEERLLWERHPRGRQPADADASSWCHWHDSFVVKVAAGELGSDGAAVVPVFPGINPIHIAVQPLRGSEKKLYLVHDEWGPERRDGQHLLPARMCVTDAFI